jgi:DNA-binding transcriptional ArsR family regulator
VTEPVIEPVTEPVTAPAQGAAWEPLAVRTINSADAIKALADPLRLRLLQLLMMSDDRTWSVKEIAGELTQPVTKLYHHIKLLEKGELITDVESRLVSGIVEHRYRASQKSLQFDDAMFRAPETRHDSIEQMAALLDSTRDGLVDYLYREDADMSQVTVSKSTARLTPEEIEAVEKTIEGMVEGFVKARDDANRAGLPRTSMFFLMNPLGHEPD